MACIPSFLAPAWGRLILVVVLCAAGQASMAATETGSAVVLVPPADSQRVFICTHSFMTFIAKLLPPMAKAGEVGYVQVGHQMLGGSQVIEHWNLTNDKAKPALQEARVDTLILSPTVQVPDAGIDRYTRLGLAANPRLRVLVQASWPAHDDAFNTTGAARVQHARSFRNTDRNQLDAAGIERMRTAMRVGWGAILSTQVAALNDAVGQEAVRIVPVYEAVLSLRQAIVAGNVPGISSQSSLFADDLGHPTVPLMVLVAYCHYTALYRRTPVGLPVPTELAGFGSQVELNRILQQTAWAAIAPTLGS